MLSIQILLFGAAILCLLRHFLVYLWDSKKLRRFHNQNNLSGITSLGYVYERCRGFRSRNLHLVHQEHSIVRIGPNSLSFSSPDAIRSIYGHATPCSKGDMYNLTRGGHASLLDVVDRNEHARKRRLLSNAFATRNLQHWEYKIVDKVGRLLAQFDAVCGEHGSGQIDFRRWTNLFTVDAIADIAASHRMGCLDRGDDCITFPSADGDKRLCRYIEGLHGPRRLNSTVVWCGSWFPYLQRALKLVPSLRSQFQKGAVFDELASHLTKQRVHRQLAGEQVDDLLGSLLQDKQGLPRDFDIDEVTAEMIVFSKSLSERPDEPHSVQLNLDLTKIPISGRRLRYHRHRPDARHVLSPPESQSSDTSPSRNRRVCRERRCHRPRCGRQKPPLPPRMPRRVAQALAPRRIRDQSQDPGGGHVHRRALDTGRHHGRRPSLHCSPQPGCL